MNIQLHMFVFIPEAPVNDLGRSPWGVQYNTLFMKSFIRAFILSEQTSNISCSPLHNKSDNNPVPVIYFLKQGSPELCHNQYLLFELFVFTLSG